MFYQLYEQTMRQLTQTLSHKFEIPVSYSSVSQLRFLKKNKRWQLEKEQFIIPLFKTGGCIQIQSKVKDQQLDEIYDHVQWTLSSLEKVFQEHGVSLFDQNNFPVFIPNSSIQDSVQIALSLYENSSAQAFIHLNARVFDPSLLAEDMHNTLILISNIEELSDQNQKFLSEYLTKNDQGPLLVISSTLPCELFQKKIQSSLMQCLNCMEKGDLSINII